MKKEGLRLGDILTREGLLTPEQLNEALKLQRKDRGEFLGSALLRLGFITEKNLAAALSRQLNIPLVSLEVWRSQAASIRNLVRYVPESFARKNCLLAVSLNGNVMTVAMLDPTDVVILDNLRKITHFDIERVIAPKSDIESGINEFYGQGAVLRSVVDATFMTEERPRSEPVAGDAAVADAEKAPVIKLFNLLLEQAIRRRASDIHIEPFQRSTGIRLRIDGVLSPLEPPDKSMILPLISRIKILAKLDIAEKRLPQDGSFSVTVDNRAIDLRVSTVPTIHGEKVVLRILDRSNNTLELEKLGFEKEELAKFRKVIRQPYGMVLITGPTGSGKTTTLYAALNEIRDGKINIMTIEDPVEYQMDGVNQVQAKPSIGLTFAAGLRAFLRQDPDVMLVGEVRDLETAQICVRAALTGHLVFSTIHTNDACSTVSRLVDIGIEPYLVASSLIMVVAQRLLRRLCPHCKAPHAPDEAMLPAGLKIEKSAKLFKPVGCDHCSKTGYAGRVAIYEVLPITEDLQNLINKQGSLQDIRAEAAKTGVRTLEAMGYQKALAGETSLEEVLRVVMAGSA